MGLDLKVYRNDKDAENELYGFDTSCGAWDVVHEIKKLFEEEKNKGYSKIKCKIEEDGLMEILIPHASIIKILENVQEEIQDLNKVSEFFIAQCLKNMNTDDTLIFDGNF